MNDNNLTIDLTIDQPFSILNRSFHPENLEYYREKQSYLTLSKSDEKKKIGFQSDINFQNSKKKSTISTPENSIDVVKFDQTKRQSKKVSYYVDKRPCMIFRHLPFKFEGENLINDRKNLSKPKNCRILDINMNSQDTSATPLHFRNTCFDISNGNKSHRLDEHSSLNFNEIETNRKSNYKISKTQVEQVYNNIAEQNEHVIFKNQFSYQTIKGMSEPNPSIKFNINSSIYKKKDDYCSLNENISVSTEIKSTESNNMETHKLPKTLKPLSIEQNDSSCGNKYCHTKEFKRKRERIVIDLVDNNEEASVNKDVFYANYSHAHDTLASNIKKSRNHFNMYNSTNAHKRKVPDMTPHKRYDSTNIYCVRNIYHKEQENIAKLSRLKLLTNSTRGRNINNKTKTRQRAIIAKLSFEALQRKLGGDQDNLLKEAAKRMKHEIEAEKERRCKEALLNCHSQDEIRRILIESGWDNNILDINKLDILPNIYSNIAYNRLGLTKDAEITEISKRYRKLALMFHPDKHIDTGHQALASKAFCAFSTAYRILVTCVDQNGITNQNSR